MKSEVNVSNSKSRLDYPFQLGSDAWPEWSGRRLGDISEDIGRMSAIPADQPVILRITPGNNGPGSQGQAVS